MFTPHHTGPSQFRFDWRLSGDRAVAPLQVFDDGRRTWLQFSPGQPVPAIFEITPTGDRPLAYRAEGPYVVLPGVWPQLVLRGGHQQSWVQQIQPLSVRPNQQLHNAAHSPASSSVNGHSSPEPGQRQEPTGQNPAKQASVRRASALAAPEGLHQSPLVTTSASAPTVRTASTVPTVPTAVAGAAGAADAHGAARPVAQATHSVAAGSNVKAADARLLTPSAAKEAGHALATTLTASSFPVSSSAENAYKVSPQDATIRQALARWARDSGWTFEPEHWALEFDIPLSGSAVFETDFKQAVRQLVAATELGDRPLQPCFYSNRVLRIVPFSQACDRGLRNGGKS